MNSGQTSTGGMELVFDIEQATNADQLIANLIKRRVQFPGMEIVSVGRLEVARFFCRNTHAQPRHHIQGIDSEGPLKCVMADF